MNILTIRACRKAIEAYGEVHQITKALEEMSELSKELCKVLCDYHESLNLGVMPGVPAEVYDHIAEEMADVMIMVTQLEMIFNNTGAVRKWIDFKTNRLSEEIAKKVGGAND
jgi:hypothetical protein